MQHFKFVNWRIEEFSFWCHEQVIPQKISSVYLYFAHRIQHPIPKLRILNFHEYFNRYQDHFDRKQKTNKRVLFKLVKKFNLWRFTFWTCYIFCSSCQKLILNSDSAIIFHNIYFCLLLMQISFYFVKLSGISTKLFIAGKLSELTLTMAIHLFGHLSV